MYKTITTVGKSGGYYVFVVPIDDEIDFKKAAKAAGEKSIEMLHLKDLTKVTGYIRGGCTAIGMKKQFPTVIQESAKELEQIHISGGRLGMQLKLSPFDLQKAANAEFADVIRRDCTGADAVFYDDRPENVGTAQRLGIKGIVFHKDISLQMMEK